MNGQQAYAFHFDYTKCMMMKLPMAHPNREGNGSVVINNFADALEIIRQVDAMTLGIQKIMYLVGWQYHGHDDKYPDFFQVNEALRREGESAHDSMLWLIREAKKYHTVVSVHINFNDAYENAPSFERFVKAGALIRNRKGRPQAIERYNGRKCYKTSFVEYWESGLFCEQFDRLLELLPLAEAGTIHVDNFQCYRNYAPDISIQEMQAARRKMIDYVMKQEIDITSEFTYREDESLPNRPFLGLPREHSPKAPLDTLGLIPASWWCTRMRKEEYVAISPQVYCGGIYKDGRYGKYLYGNMHGEDIFQKYHQKGANWAKAFLHDFACVQVPFHFLCGYRREAILGRGNNQRCVFSGGVVSYCRNQKITVHGKTVKEGDSLLLPLVHLKDTYFAYSKEGGRRTWSLLEKGYQKAALFRVNPNGCVACGERTVRADTIELELLPGEALVLWMERA